MSGGRKIVLHIGLPKTGTTTIQNVLHANRETLLAEEGVLYPSLAANLSTAFGTIFRDDPQVQWTNKVGGFTTEELAQRRENFLDSLDAEISSTEWDTLLLSAEGVCNLSEAEIARLRDWAEKYASEWIVLVCVRHPVDWTRSVIQQLLKRGKTLDQLYEKPPMSNFRVRISRAISVFGRENVKVFDFEGAVRGDGGILGAFAREAGLSTSCTDFLASRAVRRFNESLSLEATRILDLLNRQRPMFVGNVRGAYRSKLKRELGYIGRIKGQKFDVPHSVKENIRLLSREDVAWLNETFALEIYRDVADFAPQGQKSHEEPVVQEGALSDPALEDVAEIISELVTESALQGALSKGREALGRGDLERAARMLREAARLDPEAQQAKKLLREAKLLEEGAPTKAGGKGPRRFSRWLEP